MQLMMSQQVCRPNAQPVALAGYNLILVPIHAISVKWVSSPMKRGCQGVECARRITTMMIQIDFQMAGIIVLLARRGSPQRAWWVPLSVRTVHLGEHQEVASTATTAWPEGILHRLEVANV